MYLIYAVDTGQTRIAVSSEGLAKDNLGEGEAYIDIEDNLNLNGKKVVDGILVDEERPPFDPVRAARFLRTGFLAETDWTQVSDNDLDADAKQAWRNYRQELRNFPATIAAIAANEELAGNVGTLHQVEELLPTPPDGG